MSSLTVLQTKETIVFASDTAISMTHEDKSFRIGNESKIHEYKDFIMFASGKVWLKDLLLNKIGSTPTLENIELVLSETIKPLADYYSLEVIIAFKDLSKILFYSSTDDFKKKESLPSDDVQLYTAGYKTELFADTFSDNYNNVSVIKALTTTYKMLSDEKVGGNLEVYILSDEFKKQKIKIDDVQCFSDLEVYKALNLVHAERLVGRVIVGQRLYIEDENGVWETRGSTTTIYDQNGRESMYIGRLEGKDCFGIIMDNANHRINLSTCDGFKISKYQSGGNREDVMYIDLEGNIWSKYWTHDTTIIKDSQGYFDLDDNKIVIKDGSQEVMRMGYIPSMSFGGCYIQSDWGVVLKGNSNSTIFMTRNRGFAIDVDCVNKFSVNSNGNLYAQDIEATNLIIKSASVGNGITLNDADGITIKSGNNTTTMNATDGFKINNGSVDVFKVGTDGKLYLRNIYTLDNDGDTVKDLDGSFISDLTVNKLKTLTKNNRTNFVHIENNFIRLSTQNLTKMQIKFNGNGVNAYPLIEWGSGDGFGNSVATQYKSSNSFVTEYRGTDGRRRAIELTDMSNAGIILESPYGVTMQLGGSTIEISPEGIRSNGSLVVSF